jgi:hypothetical protein
VKHYLFKDYDRIIRTYPSTYEIFLNEKLVEGFEKDLDPKIVKKEAFKEWKVMDSETKKIYLKFIIFKKIKNEKTSRYLKKKSK